MQALGYVRGSRISSKVMELRQRPLAVKEIPPDLFYTPRLVREGILGWNIVETAGKYFPVRQGEHVMSAEDAKIVSAGQDGYMTLRDAEYAVIHHGTVTDFMLASQEATGATLVVEDYFGFNIVHHGGGWYGFDQVTGPIDIGSLDESALKNMEKNGVLCIAGKNSTDVKAKILRLVMQTRERRDSELAARLEAAEAVLSGLAQCATLGQLEGAVKGLEETFDGKLSKRDATLGQLEGAVKGLEKELRVIKERSWKHILKKILRDFKGT